MSAPAHATLAAPFWAAEVSSAATPDGAVRMLPFAPPPLAQMAPSGLGRAQQLHVLQRFFNVPATPSYDPGAGGVVLDRVLAEVGGGAAWWATLTARLRAQAAWNMPLTREGKPHRALCEPGVYGLAARGRVALPRRTVLRGAAHVDSLAGWLPRAAGATPGPGGAGGPLRARLQLLSQGLLPGHDVALEAAWHERAAAAGGAYAEVPRAASLSVASRRRGPLRYRAGVVADAPLLAPGAPAATAPLGALDGFGPPHAQIGAVLGGQVSFYPRAPSSGGGDGLRRSTSRGGKALSAASRGPKDYSFMPQRARVTLGAWLGGIARAPLRRAASGAAAAAPPAASPGAAPLAALRSLGAEHLAFASAVASVQLGAFSRPLLDYTSLAVRADVAAASGSLLGAARAAGAATAASLGAPAGAAGAPLGCHVTLSAAQQLVGPLRMRADLRLSAAAAAAAARGTWPREAPPVAGRTAAGASAGAARDVPIEAVYGLDVALPAVMGAARVVAWYCPQRREGLAELRFLES